MGKTFVYNTGGAKAPVDELHLQFGLFFDGTLNNLKNTQLRQKYLDSEVNTIQYGDSSDTIKAKTETHKKGLENQDRKFAKTDNIGSNAYAYAKEKVTGNVDEYRKYLKSSHRTKMDKRGTDNSFSNDFSNVARGHLCCNEEYSVYTEGIGTDDNEADDSGGFMLGAGSAGIRGKVRKGCVSLATKIMKMRPQGNDDKKLTELYIDVFGFSRGAAAARNFVYEANREAYTPLPPKREIGGSGTIFPLRGDVYYDDFKEEIDTQHLMDGKMPKNGYLGYCLLSSGAVTKDELANLNIFIRFIGAYDTVSSYKETYGSSVKQYLYGAQRLFTDIFEKNVRDLNLDKLGRYRQAVHFTAIDEHRENFALTRFPGSKEFNFPGVHCDIGGAYNNEYETVKEIETGFHKIGQALDDYREKLIENYWYKEKQISISRDSTFKYRKISGVRFLWKEYSYIPLHFMEEKFRTILGEDEKIALTDKSEIKYPIPESNHVLKQAKQHLYKYVFGDGLQWDFISDKRLNRLSDRQKEILKELKDFTSELPSKNDFPKPPTEVILQNKEEEITPIFNDKPKPGIKEIECDKEGNEVAVIEDVIIMKYKEQDLLRILRNEYLHWSATRTWAGMDPNKSNSSNPTKDYERVKR